jgi:hypothetical protein
VICTTGTVSWNICEACNYSCSYCAQGGRHEDEPERATVERICSFLCRLDPGWEVKISGGEPFSCSSFARAVKMLVTHRLVVSVVTNFSFRPAAYHWFVRTAGEMLGTISLSFHPEFVSWNAFLRKAVNLARVMRRVSRAVPKRPVINVVARREMIGALERMRNDCMRGGLGFAPQIERHRGVPVEYDAGEWAVLESVFGNYGAGGSNREDGGNIGGERMTGGSNRFRGRLCAAGVRYFIVTPYGDCFTCYPAKRAARYDGDKAGFLGNAAEGTVCLREQTEPCPYEICPCSVPLHRGMIGEDGGLL